MKIIGLMASEGKLFENVHDAGFLHILQAHIGAFASGELKEVSLVFFH